MVLPEAIGPFRILGVLGRGGMGVVYRAVHRETGERAAVKTVVAPHAGQLQSIRREIQALARIRHPGIVRVVGHGVDGGLPYCAMALVRGAPLRHLAARRSGEAQPDEDRVEPLATEETGLASGDAPSTCQDRATPDQTTWFSVQVAGEPDGAAPVAAPALPPGQLVAGELERVLTLVRRLCAPLAFLHGEGLVHRDLKPDNVLVTPRGRPVLVDFGLASQFEGRLELSVEQVTTRAAGTLRYMAPEVLLGHEVDARADLYALGCVLFELLVGRAPFVGEVGAVLRAHLYDPPPRPSAFLPDVPPALDALVERLLAKEARHRFGYAEDVAAALIAVGADPGDRAKAGAAAMVAGDAGDGAAGDDAAGDGAAGDDAAGDDAAGDDDADDDAARDDATTEVRADGERAAAATPRPRPYVVRPGLAGREETLAGLLGAVDALVAGAAGGMVLIVGESGIGKTRLTLELVSAATRRHPLLLLKGHASERGGAAMEPFVEVLEAVVDHCRQRGAEETARVFGERAAVVAELSRRLADLPGADGTPPPPLPPAAAQARLFRAIAASLAAYAAVHPLLVLLDDLQWSDELTLKFLEHAAGDPALRGRVLFVGTSRPDGETVTRLRALARPVELARLDEEAVGRIVADMLALEAPPPRLAALLADKSDGNPFFVAEYLRMAVGEGLLRRSMEGRWLLPEGPEGEAAYRALPLPGSLRALVGRRLDDLAPLVAALVRAAAVLGREATQPLLVELAGPGEGPAGAGGPAGGADGEAEALAGIAELIRRQVLEEPRPGVLRFVHDRVREVAYERVADGERRRLHARAAALLEAREGDEAAAALADHHERAGALDEAARWARRAGERAVRAAAPRDAMTHLAHAARLLDELPETPERLALKVDVRLDQIAPAYTLSTMVGAELVAVCRAAEPYAIRLGDARRLIEIYTQLAASHYGRADYPVHAEVSLRLLDEAEAIGELRVVARAGISRAAGLLQVGEIRPLLALCPPLVARIEAAGAVADSLGFAYPPYLALCSLLGWAHTVAGEVATGRRWLGRALEAARAAPAQQFGIAAVSQWASMTLAAAGAHDEALLHGRTAAAIGRERQLPAAEVTGSYAEGVAACLGGDARRGIATLERALARATEVGYRANQSDGWYGLLFGRLALGELTAARAAGERGLAFADESGERRLIPELHRGLAEVALRREPGGASDTFDLARAAHHLEAGARHADAHGARLYLARLRVTAAALRAARGDESGATDERRAAAADLAAMGATELCAALDEELAIRGDGTAPRTDRSSR